MNFVQLNSIDITRSNSFLGARDWYINFFNLIQFFILDMTEKEKLHVLQAIDDFLSEEDENFNENDSQLL